MMILIALVVFWVAARVFFRSIPMLFRSILQGKPYKEWLQDLED